VSIFGKHGYREDTTIHQHRRHNSAWTVNLGFLNVTLLQKLRYWYMHIQFDQHSEERLPVRSIRLSISATNFAATFYRLDDANGR
jgi:hypothetical protein